MLEGVRNDPQPRLNADRLDHALSHGRDELVGFESEEQRSCHEQAIGQTASYVSVLRDTMMTAAALAAAGPNRRLRRPFAFKLEFADGRWDIDEKELDATPQIGDIISFDDGLSWRIRTSQFVHARPSRKPVRELFVCAPVA